MGAGGSSFQSTEATQAIEAKIKESANSEKKVVKIVLLGAGECGKSTILKQMKIINMTGFSEEELAAGKKLVFKNVVDCMQSVCNACKEFEIGLGDEANQARVDKIMAIDISQDIPAADIKDDIVALWADEGIQKTMERKGEFNLLDSAEYFLSKAGEVLTEEFAPTVQDMLRTRQATTGIAQIEFTMEKMKFRMFDVGGQRGERKNWIHCFANVTAIMFIASLSEYNQSLAEDPTKNRLSESLDLFENIVNLVWFQKAKVILFLNKKDLFQEKIKKYDPKKWHKSYKGGCDEAAALKWIQKKYLKRNDDQEKAVYVHCTDATNTENVVYVWKACKHILVENKLEGAGL